MFIERYKKKNLIFRKEYKMNLKNFNLLVMLAIVLFYCALEDLNVLWVMSAKISIIYINFIN